MIVFEEAAASLEFGEAILPLTCEWAHEREHHININWSAYQMLFEANLLRAFVALKDEKVVGFAVFTVCPVLCEQNVTRAAMEIIYFNPKHRAGSTGYKFIKFCDQQLTAEGNINEIVFSVVTQRDYSKLLTRLGYQKIETLHRKRV